MGNYKLYELKFKAEEYGETFCQEWTNPDLEEIMKLFIEYCNIKHNTKVVLLYWRKKK